MIFRLVKAFLRGRVSTGSGLGPRRVVRFVRSRSGTSSGSRVCSVVEVRVGYVRSSRVSQVSGEERFFPTKNFLSFRMTLLDLGMLFVMCQMVLPVSVVD